MYLQSVQQGETIGDLPHVGNLTLSLDPGVGASEIGVVTVTAIGMVDHRLVDFYVFFPVQRQRSVPYFQTPFTMHSITDTCPTLCKRCT